MSTPDRWPELCQAVSADDGLVYLECKTHTLDKLIFLHRYIDITTQAMVGKPHWPNGVAYLDLYSGPGACKTPAGKRIPGSPLIAGMSKKPMSAIVCCDADAKHAAACRERLRVHSRATTNVALEGDSNQLLHSAISHIPQGALTIALIDPFGFSLRFDTFRTIAASTRADFIFLFADSMDLSRNLKHFLVQDGRIDQLLGDSDWRVDFEYIDSHAEDVVCDFFRKQLELRLQNQLGYNFIEREGIGSGNRRYYSLLFASRHELGLNFWRKACQRDSGGQASLFSPD